MSFGQNNLVEDILREYGPIEPFAPMACYNRDGDCIEFHLSNEPYYAKRLDGWVTVFLAEQTHEVVGGMVKGVRTSLLKRFPGLRIFIEGDRVKVAVVLSAPASQADELPIQKTYKALIDMVDDADLSAELQQV